LYNTSNVKNTEQILKISLFKKFTDFCAGIAAFVGGLFLLQKYMVFQPL